MRRSVVLDTETTGLDFSQGHRVVEIGCVELIDNKVTGQHFHSYLNPEREVSPTVVRIHGLDSQFLSDKPKFADVAEGFLQFIGDCELIIHNAPFDVGFLNNELSLAGLRTLDGNQIIDTLLMARRKYPGSPASLDALCKRFGVSLGGRKLHGALIDSKLLASVYLEMVTGDQGAMQFACEVSAGPIVEAFDSTFSFRKIAPTRVEKSAHEKMLSQLVSPLWNAYL